ncbi:MAG: TIGR00730 family Rossman fold protein [Acidaminococcaceae bacterium]|nr:TIGR00730 family Rossman fold protein [Acidaminococcaceae bacterium]
MNVTVFLGSVRGNKDVYKETARAIGIGLAKDGHTLVFGGSKEGLMMDMATAALENDGKVIGVVTESLFRTYGAVEGLTVLELTKKMADRISRMIELGEMFVVFPGGEGTLEEVATAMSINKLMPQMRKHIFFLNLAGYYDGLETFFKKMSEEGFAGEHFFNYCHFVTSLEEMNGMMKAIFAK